MPNNVFPLIKDKYLFKFQDETQIWVSKEFIEKNHQFPFHNIIIHSNKYKDGSYYIDMLPFHIEKVIHFLMKDNLDISSLNFKDSFDIYRTLLEYSVMLDNQIQNNFVFHLKELFLNYLKENNYSVYEYGNEEDQACISMKLQDSTWKILYIDGNIIIDFNYCNYRISFDENKYETNLSVETIDIGKNYMTSDYELLTLLNCIKENRLPNLIQLKICFQGEQFIQQVIDCIIDERIPKLKQFTFFFFDVSKSLIESCKHLVESSFIQKNHIDFIFFDNGVFQ
ncbi:hypothetical protein WA158_006354 [Blastocystis sp. Blastoise]